MELRYIAERLQNMRDEKYRAFQLPLMPNVDPGRVVGVRTPQLRALAKELRGTQTASEFMDILPHDLFEEDQLHAFLIASMRDYDACVAEIERFLPYVNNWATCDQMNPKVLEKNRVHTFELAEKWMTSEHEYTVRFGIKVLMDHFLKDGFDADQARRVAEVAHPAYYVRMMVAWYFATALAFRWDDVIGYVESDKLDSKTRMMTIRKAVESYRIPEERKVLLRAMKRN